MELCTNSIHTWVYFMKIYLFTISSITTVIIFSFIILNFIICIFCLKLFMVKIEFKKIFILGRTQFVRNRLSHVSWLPVLFRRFLLSYFLSMAIIIFLSPSKGRGVIWNRTWWFAKHFYFGQLVEFHADSCTSLILINRHIICGLPLDRFLLVFSGIIWGLFLPYSLFLSTRRIIYRNFQLSLLNR